MNLLSRQQNIGQISAAPFTQQWAELASVADQLTWLQRHRLLAVVPLLAERGLVAEEIVALTEPLAKKRGRVQADQLAEEVRVLAGLFDKHVRALALKGAGLGWSVYPKPDQRWRRDLDVLVSPEQLDQARSALDALGYHPMWRTAGGTPMDQESWLRRPGDTTWVIDLHWGLRNHPVLRGALEFEEQWAQSVELPHLAPGARAQSPGHALLSASMHWFDDLYAHSHPLGWLLDKDLLWRCLGGSEQEALSELAIERGLAGLLAESLRMTRQVFGTPIPDGLLENLTEAGKAQRATRLIQAGRHPFSAHWFALQSEPNHAARLHRLRSTLFPPAAHLRERFPDGSRLGLPGLYLRRWLRRAVQDG